MKRTREGAVVREGPPQAALRRGLRAREMIGGVVSELAELSDAHFVSARHENLETIHEHNVVAERFGLLGELRHEVASGERASPHVDAPLARRRQPPALTAPALRAGWTQRRRLDLAQHAPQTVHAADDRGYSASAYPVRSV